jgi:hypothetical protein
MLRLLDRDVHAHRLRDLLARFRAHELSLDAELQALQAVLELTHREASNARCQGACAERALTCSTELQQECDAVAVELVHVRMAVAGTCEELREHDERRFACRALSTPA